MWSITVVSPQFVYHHWFKDGLIMSVPNLTFRTACSQLYWTFQHFMFWKGINSWKCVGQCCQSLLAAEFCSDCTCVCCSTGYVLCQLQTNSSQIANFKNGCMTRVCHEKGRNVHYGTAGEPWSVRTSTQTATRLSRPPAKTDFPPLHSVRNAHASQPIRDPIDSRHTGPMFFFLRQFTFWKWIAIGCHSNIGGDRKQHASLQGLPETDISADVRATEEADQKDNTRTTLFHSVYEPDS